MTDDGLIAPGLAAFEPERWRTATVLTPITGTDAAAALAPGD